MMNKKSKLISNLIFDLRNAKCPRVSFKALNKRLETVTEQVKGLGLLPFDSNLPHDFDECYRSLIGHRASTKFTRPGDRSRLREVAFSTYKGYEDEISTISPCVSYGDACGHKIKLLFSQVCADFNIRAILREAPIRFSPGETFIASEGETSIQAKLSLKEHWTVTGPCLDDAVYLIYNCRGLKQAAKAHMPILDRETRSYLFSRFRNHGDKCGYMVFRYLLIKYVLTIVDGARASSVPKNDKTDRFINIEAFFNVLVQACIEWYFRRKLRRYGNDLNFKDRTTTRIRDTQHLHGLLLKDPDLCTIDLKNASDSTLMDRMKLLPPWLSGCIARTRSPEVIFPDGSTVFPLKVSSMGNGYTFGLMSFLIYFSLLAHNISSNIFGDDIIVHKKDVNKTLEILKYLGYQLNLTKTFIEHPFRESCGYFHYIGKGYLRSYDLTYIESYTDAVVNTNKLFVLWQDCVKAYYYDLADIFEAGYKDMLAMFQASQKGPVPYGNYLIAENLGLYVYDFNFAKKQRSSVEFASLYKKCLRVMDLLGLSYEDAYYVGVPRYIPEITSQNPTKQVQTLLELSGYGKGVVRGKGCWKMEIICVSPTGVTYRFGQLSCTSDDDASSLTTYEPKLPI